MRFAVFGGFTIARKANRHGVFDKNFWNQVTDSNQNLAEACGCYVFALKNGNNIVSWYVGKTEKRTFQRECFQPTKINYYNEVLIDRHGTPLLFLLPRLTKSRMRFSKPTKSGYRDIDFLETMLIGMALERNRELMNVKKTKLLRELIVPGIINNPPQRPSRPALDLQRALGI
jgi:hypothetical protein